MKKEKTPTYADEYEALPPPTQEYDQETADTSSPSHSSPEIHIINEDEKKGEKLRLILMLICTVLALISVIVYGVAVSGTLSQFKTPISERLLSEVFGTGITTLSGTYARVPLVRIPSQTVTEGEDHGAAEQESVSEDTPPPQGGITYPVKEVDLSVSGDNIFSVINETPYAPDVMTLFGEKLKSPISSEITSKHGKNAPAVLILHTHGTESYLPDGARTYSSDEAFRSYDTGKNVVAVGRAVASRLREHGIGVIHLETMFDAEDYNSAYYLAAKEISRITEKYPSVAYVFDIHRDAMITSEGVNLKPTSPITTDGGKTAQIMLVIGTDHAGSSHTEWQDNLIFALKLQRSALNINGGIMRSLNLRSASFNEQYTKGSLIVEIGAAANSLEEACRAGRIFADAAAGVIKGEVS